LNDNTELKQINHKKSTPYVSGNYLKVVVIVNKKDMLSNYANIQINTSINKYTNKN